MQVESNTRTKDAIINEVMILIATKLKLMKSYSKYDKVILECKCKHNEKKYIRIIK